MKTLRTISRTTFCLAMIAVCAVGATAQEKPKAVKIKASAIQVDMIHSDEIKLPAEFQVSMYEDLIRQLQKKGGFAHVYREGDRNASSSPDLVILRSNVTGFKEGSQRKREVTTVAGETVDQDSLHFRRQRRKNAARSRCHRQSPLLWRKPPGHV